VSVLHLRKKFLWWLVQIGELIIRIAGLSVKKKILGSRIPIVCQNRKETLNWREPTRRVEDQGASTNNGVLIRCHPSRIKRVALTSYGLLIGELVIQNYGQSIYSVSRS